MTQSNRRPMRRASAAVLAAVLAVPVSAVAGGVAPVSAAEGFAFERLAGADRYATAAAIAREAFTTADNVVLASGAPRNFPDALAGNYLAGVGAGPVLLTAPGSLPGATLDALAALRAKRVFIVGGPVAVSAAVEGRLRSAGYTVERLGGLDRYATAELVAKRVGGLAINIGTIDGQRTALLGNGQTFPDILAAGPLSYSDQFPLTITRSTDLPVDTRDVLRDLRIQRVIIVGGTAAVSAGVAGEVAAMGITVTRLQGADRFGTAVAIADYAYQELGYDTTRVNLARSDDFADALAGGPHAGREMAPIVLTPPAALSATTRAFLAARSATLTSGHIFGGENAVRPVVVAAAASAASGVVTVTMTSTSVEAGQMAAGTITGDISTGTVSGCGLTDRTIGEDRDTAAAGRQFSLSVPVDQPEGACTLTFTLSRTADGAPVVRTVELVVTAAPDTAGPSVAAPGTAPEAGSTSVVFTASEALAEASVTVDDFTITGGVVQATVTGVAVFGSTVTVTTTPLREGNVVTLRAESVTDLAGNDGPSASVATAATTPPRDTGPTVAAPDTAPAVGETSVVFTASEALAEASVTVDDFTITGGVVQATVSDVAVSGSTVTVTTTPLSEGNVVTLRAASVMDLADNAGPADDVSTAPASDPVSETP